MAAPTAVGSAHYGRQDTPLSSDSSPYLAAKPADAQADAQPASLELFESFVGVVLPADTQADALPPTLDAGESFAGVVQPADTQADALPATLIASHSFIGVAAAADVLTGNLPATINLTSPIFSMPTEIRFVDELGDATHDLRQYYAAQITPGEEVTDIRLAAGSAPLPAGVSIDVANEQYVFTDATGVPVSVSGILLEVETSPSMVNGIDMAAWKANLEGLGDMLLDTDFSEFADSAALEAGVAFASPFTAGIQLEDNPLHRTSGKSVYIPRPDTTETADTNWNAYLSGAGDVSYERLYKLGLVKFSAASLGYCQRTSDGDNSTPKTWITDWFNGTLPTQDSELVLDNYYMTSALSCYRFEWNGLFPVADNIIAYSGFVEDRAVAYGGTDLHFQNGIDKGVPLVPANYTEQTERYGLVFAGATDARPPQGQLLSANGRPWPPIAIAGGNYVADDWMVIGEFYDFVADSFQVWMSVLGGPPVLIHNYVGNARHDPSIPANERPNTWVITDYLTNGIAEVGQRPLMERWYAGMHVRETPIPWPGFESTPWPGNQG